MTGIAVVKKAAKLHKAGLRHKEIARELNVKSETVSKYLHLARKMGFASPSLMKLGRPSKGEASEQIKLAESVDIGSMPDLVSALSVEAVAWLVAQTGKGTLSAIAAEYLEDAYLENLEKLNSP